MNTRSLAAEVVALAVGALWVYGGIALAVAALGDGASVSFGAVASVVVLSYLLARLLGQIDVAEGVMRLWGAGLSVGLLYLVLRIDIAGEPYLWELGWLADLVSEPGRTLEGHAGDVTEVVLLGAAWLRGILRGADDLTFESVLAEVSLGLVVVLLAAAFASGAEAPGVLRWLPVPYMVAGLLALALAHLRSVEAEPRRPFLRVWTLWTGGSLGVMAGLALLTTLFDPPSLAAIGDGLAVAARGVGLAVGYAVSPFIFAVAWVMEHLIGWLGSGEPFKLEEQDMSDLVEEREEEAEPARWSRVLWYVFRSGLVVLVIVVALAVLWLAFRRFSRWREDEAEVREEMEPEEGSALVDLASALADALARLRGRGAGGPRGRDAIGRLYLSMLQRAAARGLPRPPAATPLEFAPRLEEHFQSPVPGAISRAYVEARYGRRPRRREEVAELRSRWREELSRVP